MLFRAQAQLGEGPVWLDNEASLYWVDILSHTVHRLHFENGDYREWTVPEQITSLAPRRSGGFVCTIRDGFAFWDPQDSRLQPIDLVEASVEHNRFNDGKCDRAGNFWAGSMDDNQREKSAALYRLAPDLQVERVDDSYIISNGPAFTRDESILFHNETKLGQVYRLTLNSSGGLADKSLFKVLKPSDGLPDGMTVDSEDCLWLAHFGGGRVSRFSPSGELIGRIDVPAPNVTSCTFGGPGNQQLFITTARVGMNNAQLERQPLAGSVFVCEPGISGVSTGVFAG